MESFWNDGTVGQQIFASALDQQVKSVLISNLFKNLEKCDNNWMETYRNEITTGLDIGYNAISMESSMVASSSSTARSLGMSISNLQWKVKGDTLLYVSLLTLKYILTEFRRLSVVEGWRNSEESWKQHIEHYSKALLTLLKAFDLFSYLRFLRSGDYLSLFHRIAGFQMAPQISSSSSSGTPTQMTNTRSSAAGPNRYQLFLELRKLVMQIVIGVLSAQSIAIDWLSVRYTCYFYSIQLSQWFARQIQQPLYRASTRIHSFLLSMLTGIVKYATIQLLGQQQQHQQPGIVSNNRDILQTCFQFLSFGLSQGRNNEPDSSSTQNMSSISAQPSDRILEAEIEDEPELQEEEELEEHDRDTNTDEEMDDDHSSSSSGSSRTATSLTCCYCDHFPVEIPYQSNCGHTYCYLCIYPLLPKPKPNNRHSTTATTSSSSSTSSVSSADEKEEYNNTVDKEYCRTCFAVLSFAQPLDLSTPL